MKTNELRLNNLVYGVSDRIERITAINGDLVKTNLLKIDAESQFVYSSHIEPIPLTEKWLFKMNFNFKELGYKELSVSHHLTNNKFYFIISGYAKEIHFVHELQNLYFALTNNELEIL